MFEYKRLTPVYPLAPVLPLNYRFVQGLAKRHSPTFNNKNYTS